MKKEIEKILKNSYTNFGEFDESKATKELLDLFNVVGQSEQVCCDKCGSKEIQVWNNHSNCTKCLNVW